MPGGGEGIGWESRAVAAAAAGRQEMSGETRWDVGGMDGCAVTDGGRR